MKTFLASLLTFALALSVFADGHRTSTRCGGALIAQKFSHYPLKYFEFQDRPHMRL